MERHKNGAEETPQSGQTTDLTPTATGSDLGTAAMPATSLPLADLFKLFAPASITVPKSAVEDVIMILSETIYLFEDSADLDAGLENVLRSIAAGESISRGDAASLTPTHGDVVIREVTSIAAADRKLNRATAVEFEFDHPRTYGCIVSVSRGAEPETLKVTIDWRDDLRFQSSFAVDNRWQLIEDLMPSLSAIDPDQATVTSCGERPNRYALSDGLTFDVLPRDERHSDILSDPHLSRRPDLVHLCALRSRFEEDEDRLELDERIGLLYRRISNLCPDISIEDNFDDVGYPRETLVRCGAVPFLAASNNALEAIVIENFILIATRESTGDSLLADLAYLEQLSASAAVPGACPQPDRITSLEIAAPDGETAERIFALLDLPDKEYFISALSDFVAYENIAFEEDLMDGVYFALGAGKPLTVALTREFIVEGAGPTPRSAESPEPWATSTWESEEDPDNVELYRSVRVFGALSDDRRTIPAIGFVAAHGGTAAEALHSRFIGDAPILELSMRLSYPGDERLPTELTQGILAHLGHRPGEAPLLAAEDEPVVGERTGYLSDSVRVRFTL